MTRLLLLPRAQLAARVSKGTEVALRDRFSNLVAVLTVSDKWTPDKALEARSVFGTEDRSHPGVGFLFDEAGPVYLGGSLRALMRPHHYDFPELRRTPAQVRELAQQHGWMRFVAFQTRNPMHRAHIELTKLAGAEVGAGVLIHPVVGMTKPGDVEYHIRVRCYQAIIDGGRHYPKGGAMLSLLPLAMRMAGPREALWHAIIRKNHGATHFIVGRDHAGCKSSGGDDFYGPYDAQELVARFADEIGITMVKFKQVSYVASQSRYLPDDKIPAGASKLAISGTKFRAMMASGEPIPEWFSDPDVIAILRRVSPPLPQRGFTVFFSGLSGSGKSTIAAALAEKLRSVLPTRPITMLDGDVVRTHLSKNLGFSTADRNTNIARIGWVAASVTRHGGIAIAPTIAPFELSRQQSRAMVSETGGGFLLVHVSTSLAECMRRDVKGLYHKAQETGMKITGLSHPYENPEQAELTIDAEAVAVEDSVRYILAWLHGKGYLEGKVAGARGSKEDSMAVLSGAGILSEGAPDRVGDMCAPARDVGTIYAVAATPKEAELVLREVNGKAKPAGVQAFPTSAVVAMEAQSGTPAPAMAGKGDSVTVDAAWPTGLPATSGAKLEDARVEVAWAIFTKARGEAKPGQVTAAHGPRLAAYLPEILRIQPCARVVAVLPAEGDAPGSAVHAAAAPEGSSVTDAHHYAKAFRAAMEALAKRFPSRVFIGDASKTPTSAAKAAKSLSAAK